MLRAQRACPPTNLKYLTPGTSGSSVATASSALVTLVLRMGGWVCVWVWVWVWVW
jgi:hypothetical protein